MQTPDIRWKQRFSNYRKALLQFKEAVTMSNDGLNDLEKEGLIQRFEYCYDLAWKVMKDYAQFQGIQDITGTRDAVREAFKMGLIDDGQTWINMLESRNLTSHTYNKMVADTIVDRILGEYADAFFQFETAMCDKE